MRWLVRISVGIVGVLLGFALASAPAYADSGKANPVGKLVGDVAKITDSVKKRPASKPVKIKVGPVATRKPAPIKISLDLGKRNAAAPVRKATKPVARPVVKRVARPSAKPIVKRTVVRPVAKPVVKRAAKPVARPATKITKAGPTKRAAAAIDVPTQNVAPIDLPAIELATVEVAELALPTLNMPTLELSQVVHVGTIRLPDAELPTVQLPAVVLPRVEVPAMELLPLAPPIQLNQPPGATTRPPGTVAPRPVRFGTTPTASGARRDQRATPAVATPVSTVSRVVARGAHPVVTLVAANRTEVTAALLSSTRDRIADVVAEVTQSISPADAGVAVGLVAVAALGVAASGSASSAASGFAGLAVAPLTSSLIAAAGTRRMARTLRQSSWRLSQNPGFAPD